MICYLPQWNYTPLHWAASNGLADVCDRLISAGADVNASEKVSDCIVGVEASMWYSTVCIV